MSEANRDKPAAATGAHAMGAAPKYRPVPWRRRVLLLALAIATATTVILTMLDPAARAQRQRAEAAALQPAVCNAGQTSGCVGGKADVILLPAGPASGATAGSVPAQ